MASAFPQIIRCTLGQGGGPAYLRALGWRPALEVEVRMGRGAVAVTQPVVRENLAEPTRQPPR